MITRNWRGWSPHAKTNVITLNEHREIASARAEDEFNGLGNSYRDLISRLYLDVDLMK